MQDKRSNPRPRISSMDGFVHKPVAPKLRPVPAVQKVTPLINRPLGRVPAAVATPDKKAARKHPRRRKRLLLAGGAVSLAVLLVGGWLGWKILRNSNRVFGGGLQGTLAGLVDPATKLQGEDVGRVNILLAGDSSDDPGHGGADLTDSIMLLSLDTKNNKAMMLSIPRDLWVNIPNYGGHSKINAMNYFGGVNNFSQAGYPNGGMGLLQKTVSQDFGVPINYYVKINYTAFRDSVNAVGGIDVNVQSTDPRGFYDPNISKPEGGPLKLANGVQHLDGQTALNFARARGDPTYDGRVAYGYAGSDFTRTQNQRTMLVSLKSKAVTAGVLTNPVKLGQLLDSVGNNIQTNLKLSEVKRLYQIGQKINNSDVQSLSLQDPTNHVDLLASYSAPDGSSALIPAAGLDTYGPIQLFLKKQTSSDPVVKESPSVVVLNGSQIAGLASREGNTLSSKGYNVLTMANAPAATTQTFVIDNTAGKKPASKVALQQLFGSATAQSAHYTTNLSYNADFIIVLGDNQSTGTATKQ